MSDDLQGSLENAAIYGAIQRGNNQRAQQMRPQGPPCPYCGGPIPRIGVELCMHCNHKLAWVDSTPCKPGEEQAVRSRLAQLRHRERIEQKKTQDKAFFFIGVLCLFLVIVAVLLALQVTKNQVQDKLDQQTNRPPVPSVIPNSEPRKSSLELLLESNGLNE